MSISASGHGSRVKIRSPKVKGLPAIPSTNSQKLTFSAPQKDAGSSAMVNSSKNSQDGKNPPRYTAMIIEALVAMQKQNGSEIGAICSFIEETRGSKMKANLAPEPRSRILSRVIAAVFPESSLVESEPALPSSPTIKLKMHEVPQNFRRLLSSKLRQLVAQNKIEKVQKGTVSKTTTSQQKLLL